MEPQTFNNERDIKELIDAVKKELKTWRRERDDQKRLLSDWERDIRAEKDLGRKESLRTELIEEMKRLKAALEQQTTQAESRGEQLLAAKASPAIKAKLKRECETHLGLLRETGDEQQNETTFRNYDMHRINAEATFHEFFKVKTDTPTAATLQLLDDTHKSYQEAGKALLSEDGKSVKEIRGVRLAEYYVECEEKCVDIERYRILSLHSFENSDELRSDIKKLEALTARMDRLFQIVGIRKQQSKRLREQKERVQAAAVELYMHLLRADMNRFSLLSPGILSNIKTFFGRLAFQSAAGGSQWQAWQDAVQSFQTPISSVNSMIDNLLANFKKCYPEVFFSGNQGDNLSAVKLQPEEETVVRKALLRNFDDALIQYSLILLQLKQRKVPAECLTAAESILQTMEEFRTTIAETLQDRAVLPEREAEILQKYGFDESSAHGVNPIETAEQEDEASELTVESTARDTEKVNYREAQRSKKLKKPASSGKRSGRPQAASAPVHQQDPEKRRKEIESKIESLKAKWKAGVELFEEAEGKVEAVTAPRKQVGFSPNLAKFYPANAAKQAAQLVQLSNKIANRYKELVEISPDNKKVEEEGKEFETHTARLTEKQNRYEQLAHDWYQRRRKICFVKTPTQMLFDEYKSEITRVDMKVLSHVKKTEENSFDHVVEYKAWTTSGSAVTVHEHYIADHDVTKRSSSNQRAMVDHLVESGRMAARHFKSFLEGHEVHRSPASKQTVQLLRTLHDQAPRQAQGRPRVSGQR